VVITIFINILVIKAQMLETLLITSALILLGIGTFTDFRKREVPDWLSYTSIAFAVAARMIASLAAQSWTPLIEGAIGFGAFLLIALLMYYTGQWGGGDSKVMMGLGALIGIPLAIPSIYSLPFLSLFLLNVLLIGSIYGLIYTAVLAILNQEKFLLSFRAELHRRRLVKWLVYIFSIIFIAFSIIIQDTILRLMLLMLSAVFLTIFYTWLFIKAIELSVMVRYIPIERLTEGDWIAEEVKIGGKYICGPKDLGIEKKQIALLLKYQRLGKIRQIKVKEGIPGFLLAFIATLAFGNWLSLLLLI
jgi:Flp pilus assembly protein protease CpaA